MESFTTSLSMPESSSVWQPLRNFSYASCDHAWSYLGKVVLISRSVLNAAIRSESIVDLAGKGFPEAVKPVINRLKLFSIVSVPFSLVNLHSIVGKIFNNFLLKDREGILLSTLSFTVITADIIDSLTSFINASLVLSCIAPIQIFSAMGLPLGFTMAGLGTISRVIRISKDTHLYQNQNKEIASDSSLKELSKKIKIDAFGVTANAFMLTALTIFSLGSVSALPHVLKSISYTIRLAALYNQNN